MSNALLTSSALPNTQHRGKIMRIIRLNGRLCFEADTDEEAKAIDTFYETLLRGSLKVGHKFLEDRPGAEEKISREGFFESFVSEAETKDFAISKTTD